MSRQVFNRKTFLPFSPEEVFRWHSSPGALQRLLPPWQSVRVVASDGGIEPGKRVTLQLSKGFIRFKWVAEHQDWIENRLFSDYQLKGPFRYWKHFHEFKPGEMNGQTGTWLNDRIEYLPPLGIPVRFIESDLGRIFRFRHERTRQDLVAAKIFDGRRMKIAISGAGGLIGSNLASFLSVSGHQVVRLVRHCPQRSDELQWSPMEIMDLSSLSGFDAVIHLAGEGIAHGRWNEKKKKRIHDSRVIGTQNLVASLLKLSVPPKVFVCASAVGYYGDRKDEILEETTSPGDGFLADTCQEWESAADPLRKQKVRVVNLRFGVVLSPQGGALRKMLLPFRLGLGGRVGHGRQYFPWISIDDVVYSIGFTLSNPFISGPVNLVSPNPVQQRVFASTLAGIMNRPAIFPVPAFMLRLIFGEMADEALLSSVRGFPRVLLEKGYSFVFPDLQNCLGFLLGCSSSNPSSL